MSVSHDSTEFLRAQFQSVWSLELLLHLRRNPDKAWPKAELVAALRASDAVIATGVQALVAGGLIVTDAEDCSRYAPVTEELDQKVRDVADLYAIKPDAVRRLIVSSAQSGLAAFADAFRLRRD